MKKKNNRIPRREVLKAVSLIIGSSFTSPAIAQILEGYEPKLLDSENNIFKSLYEQRLIEEIADTIIPNTTTPGAKAAGVGEFIQLIVNDCYTPTQQKAFQEGLSETDRQAEGLFQKKFVECDTNQRTDVLKRIEARAFADRNKEKNAFSFWFAIKELTITGYFTSEIGCKQALEYVQIPARYEACKPITKDQKLYAGG